MAATMLHRLFLCGLTLIVSGCAGGFAPPPTPGPEAIPGLEAQLLEWPDDPEVLSRLGAAYRAAERPEEAVETLERARRVAPEAPTPVLLLGLTYEDLGRWGEARELYGRYLSLVPESPVADQLRGRVRLAERREIEALVREGLARERELTEAPSPTTLAVFPFRFSGGDAELAPLGHALAGMLTTDLAEGGRFQLLERTHLDVLLSEMALAEEGLVDPHTAARSGRILGAGRIVQGRFGGSEARFEVDATVVEVTAGDPAVRPVGLDDGLSRLLEMEKALVFELFESMGVTLTQAERERILARGTDNLQALLAYGRGLEASHQGRYGQAADHFRNAARLDPSFNVAREEAAETEEIAAAAETSTSEMLAGASQEVEVPVLIDPVEIVEGAASRDPAQEALGTDQIRSGVILEIVIRLPGGDQ